MYPTEEEKFIFDLQGFLLIKNVIEVESIQRILDKTRYLEQQNYQDRWRENSEFGDACQPTKQESPASVRLNGLLRLDSLYDHLFSHPRLQPYLNAFMECPQLINTWSISKMKNCPAGGWHRGIQPCDYYIKDDQPRTRMFNFVFLLTDNGPEDGCVVAVPASHKAHYKLKWKEYEGLALPGSVPVTGKAGDVFMFSEATMHTGLPKTTEGVRTNLYMNFVERNFNGMMYSPEHNYHYCMPQSIRDRFDDTQLALTEWMKYFVAEEKPPADWLE